MTGTPMQVEYQPPLRAPVEQGLPGEPAAAPPPPYEMRPLVTEHDRDAVAKLITERMKWLNERRAASHPAGPHRSRTPPRRVVGRAWSRATETRR